MTTQQPKPITKQLIERCKTYGLAGLEVIEALERLDALENSIEQRTHSLTATIKKAHNKNAELERRIAKLEQAKDEPKPRADLSPIIYVLKHYLPCDAEQIKNFGFVSIDNIRAAIAILQSAQKGQTRCKT